MALTLLAVRADAELARGVIRTLTEGCNTTPIVGCEIETRGTLGTGDCTFSDGTRYDLFRVALAAGKQVAFTLRPLDSSYTTPALLVIGPSGEFQTPPAVYGNRAATVWVQTFTAGDWTVAASTQDVFAGGRYVLHVECFPGTDPRRDCVSQEILCGQTAEGSITAESCRFSSAPRGYSEWEIYGVAGDTLSISEESFDFEPLFGVYDSQNHLLQSSTRSSSLRAVMTFSVPSTGWYHIDATSTTDNKAGDFVLKVGCSRSGCVFPFLASESGSWVVPYDQPATIAMDIRAIGPTLTTQLIEGLAVVATSSTSQIVTPPIRQAHAYYLSIQNECGGWESNVFTVSPDRTPRRRSVRK